MRLNKIKLLLLLFEIITININAQVIPIGFKSNILQDNEVVTTAVVRVTTATGKVWMDRNLGATRQATSTTDSEAYGYLYQWGRGNDQHQFRTSNTTSASSNNNFPGHSFFILGTNYSLNDWRITQNSNLWQIESNINNPCPTGFRPPTSQEINNERLSWISNNASGAYESVLKLPLGGWREMNGRIERIGNQARYWTLSPDQQRSYYLYFDNTNAWVQFNEYRARGLMIRCICSLNIPTLVNNGILNNILNATNAIVDAYLVGDGGAPILERGFVWSTSPKPTTQSSKLVVTGTTVRFQGNLTGLTPSTTYYWTAYAINSEGIAYGVIDGVFTTKDQ